ncbi:MAG: hypothetical protein KGH75_04695 [Rhodospirillales bacterium]|nr:hypothetical protein [Rhodospirillales bacterium]
MGQIIKFAALALALALAVGLAVVAGDYGPWYFAWLVGTTMIVLISTAGAVLFDTQETRNDGEI